MPTPAPVEKKKVSEPPLVPVEPVVSSGAPAPISQSELAVSSAPSQSAYDASAATIRAALVNILCYAPAGGGVHSISGSGVFIDPKGIILTNAHIAQYFLLAHRQISCVIRTGSPAIDSYKAALIYISPEWVTKNPLAITQETPTGTGEYDFALLAVEKSATNAPLPSSFPSLSLATRIPESGAPVVIASYGAQFLETSQIRSFLFPTVVFGSIKEIFTFATSTADVISLGGSAAAQEGSSGGGVAGADAALIAIITTSTITGPTDTRKLSAITASYVRSEYAREAERTLESLLAMPVTDAISAFKPQAVALEATLLKNLPQ